MDAIKCPSCGSTDLIKISAAEFRCEHCRTLLSITSPTATNPLDDVTPCPHCGTPHPGSKETCGACLKKLPAAPENGTTNALVNEVIYHPGGRDMDLVQVVRWLKNRFQLSLKQAKTLSAGSCTLARGVPLELAEAIRDNFEAWGAIVEIRTG